jgi:predicted phosphodiesterase
MSTIAIVSDIHANLPALEAVLADLGHRSGIDGTYHLGDLVGYAPWPNEVADLLQRSGVPGIAGNYDSTVATHYKHCGCSYEDPKDVELAHLSYSWTLEHTSDASKAYLGSLPFRMDLRPWGGHLPGPRITLIHGNPVLNTVYWTEDRPDSFCLQMAEKTGARPGDTIVFGHTHKPWARRLQGIQFINAGSVGRPKDGDWKACYLLLHLDPEAQAETGSRIRPEFVRVEYDLQRATDAIRTSTLPDEFAAVLERGGG